MLLVKADHLTFKYPTHPDELFSDLSFTLNSRSRVGLIGKNGHGKSTLLRLLQCEHTPTSGHIQFADGLRTGYLAQLQPHAQHETVEDFVWSVNTHLFKLKKRVDTLKAQAEDADWSLFSDFEEAGGYEFEIQCKKLMREVHLSEPFLSRHMHTLSGGEKTKVGLLRILLTQPDLLFFDEPTNNLDIYAIQWMIDYLQQSKIPYILVSHDRTLLNQATDETWELKSGKLNIHSGNYEHYCQTKELRYQNDLEKFEQQKKKISKLNAAATERRVQASKMESFKESRSVKNNGGLCKRDEGSGSGQANPTKKMRSAIAVEKRIHQMIEREEANKPWIEKRRKIVIPLMKPCLSQYVLRIDGLNISYNEKSILQDLVFSIQPGQRVAIVGKNGCGKTSLIKAISADQTSGTEIIRWAPTAKAQFFFQNHDELKADDNVLESVQRENSQTEHFVRTVLGSLGIDANLMTRTIRHLSPGERVKVSLAKVILSGANVLVLDEPTNHLEIPAREMLELALLEYQGSVIFASHDLEFIEQVSTQIFDLAQQKMYPSFEEWRGHT